MGYNPEEIKKREFTRVFKGYDRDEVDAYLVELSSVVGTLSEEVSKARSVADDMQGRIVELESKGAEATQFDALSEHVNEMLRGAKGVGDDIRIKAQTEADAILAAAHNEVDRLTAESEDRVRENRTQADRLLTEAKDESDRIKADADNRAQQLMATTTTETENARAEAAAESERMIAEARSQAETLRKELDDEMAALRSQTETERTTLLNDAQERLNDAQNESEALVESANADADRIRFDAEKAGEDLKVSIENSFVQQRAEAENYAELKRSEGDEYLATKRSDADEYVRTKHAEADEYVAARQGEVYKDAKEAERERDKALAEIEDARTQVADMLEQARAQNEFLRHEAEDVIRAKVRQYIDQTERRVSRLKVTEQASRERILAAQKELASALNSVGSEQIDLVAEISGDDIISEAHDRLIGPGDRLEKNSDKVEIIDLDTDKAANQSSVTATNTPAEAVSNQDEVKQATQKRVNFVDLEDRPKLVEDDAQPSDDALSKLVREAMQQAVDTATKSEADQK